MTATRPNAPPLAQRALDERIVTRIWQRDASLWGAPPASPAAHAIALSLGWLDVARTMAPEVERIERLAHEGRTERVQSVFLLASPAVSLAAQVMRQVLGPAEGAALHVLQGPGEAPQPAGFEPARSWFVVASKSGRTADVLALEDRLRQSLPGAKAGRQFMAITDPGTELQQRATTAGYREVFLNPPDIGARFSALSPFGLVPAGMTGVPVRDVLAGAAAMSEGCRQENHANAGLELGAFIAGAAFEGRRHLTLELPASIGPLSRWIAELLRPFSAGATPIAVADPLPGAGRDAGDALHAFVSIATDRDEPDKHRLAAIERHGHPLMRLSIRLDNLGAEFFRWEFAAAVAGGLTGINPFAEPADS